MCPGAPCKDRRQAKHKMLVLDSKLWSCTMSAAHDDGALGFPMGCFPAAHPGRASEAVVPYERDSLPWRPLYYMFEYP
jgi:hypothetical protein